MICDICLDPVYRDDYIALFHADCKDLLSFIPQSKQIVIISDPPYGIKWVHSDNPRPIIGDDAPFDPFHLIGYKAVLFGGHHYYTRLPQSGSFLIWDKRCSHGKSKACNIGPCHINNQGDYEDIWCSFKAHRTIYRHMWNGYVKASEKGIPRIHPTQKPIMLMQWLIESFTTENDVIVDPYAGSCSTLVAARLLKRHAIGIEIDKRNIPAAIERLKTDPFKI